MTRDEIIAKLRKIKPLLDDIDILVEFEKTPGLFDFVALRRKLTSRFHRRVDLATPRMIRAEMKDRVLGDAVYAYA